MMTDEALAVWAWIAIYSLVLVLFRERTEYFLRLTGFVGMLTGFIVLFKIMFDAVTGPGMKTVVYMNVYGEAWLDLGIMVLCTPGVIWCALNLWRPKE